jgi:hypothetical protein
VLACAAPGSVAADLSTSSPADLAHELITAGLVTVEIIELPDAQQNDLGDRRFRAGTRSRCRGLRSTGSDSWLPPNGRSRCDPAARLTD